MSVKRKTVKFGVVGCGLMGREFASAAARWCHLLTDLPAPEIVAVCDLNEQARGWFTMSFERYEEVPSNVAQKIIENAKLDEDEEE